MPSFLQDLLDVGLVDIGTDDARYGYIEEAAATLSQHLSQHLDEVVPATLLALSAEASGEQPVLRLVEDELRTRWRSLRTVFKERDADLFSLFRIMLLAALRQAAGLSDRLASIVWLTAESIWPHIAAGAEQDLLRRFLEQNLALRTERLAAAAYGREVCVPTAISMSAIEVSLPSLQGQVVSTDDYLRLIMAAAGPLEFIGGTNRKLEEGTFTQAHYTQGGATGTGPNPQWAGTNADWSFAFAPRMNEVLVRAINQGAELVTTQLSAALKRLGGQFQKFLDSQASVVTQLMQQFAAQQTTAQLRTAILWWQRSLYSESLRRSYRDLPAPAAAIAMAHDLFDIVSDRLPTPASVVWVLSETVHGLSEESFDRPQKLPALLDRIACQREVLKGRVGQPPVRAGRRPLIEVVEAVVHKETVSIEELQVRCGLRPETEVSLSTLAMWCFRDLQVRRLCEEQGA